MDLPNGGAGDVAGAIDETAEAIEFVRFCHRRKRVGWPELYDEMCAVAGRGLYRGFGPEELAEIGIGFGLFQMPALAGLVARVLTEEAERRRRTEEDVRPAVVLAAKGRRSSAASAALAAPGTDEPAPAPAATLATRVDASAPELVERTGPDFGSIRIALPAGA
jgi:hypothetical protein